MSETNLTFNIDSMAFVELATALRVTPEDYDAFMKLHKSGADTGDSYVTRILRARHLFGFDNNLRNMATMPFDLTPPPADAQPPSSAELPTTPLPPAG